MHILMYLCSILLTISSVASIQAAANPDPESQILFCSEELETRGKKPGARTASQAFNDDDDFSALPGAQADKRRKLLNDASQYQNVAGTIPEQLTILDDYFKLKKYNAEPASIFPMLVYGEPGSGKTTWIQALALKYNFSTDTINTQEGKPNIDAIKLAIAEACQNPSPTVVIIEHIDAWLEVHREKIIRILRAAQEDHPHMMFIGESTCEQHIDTHREFETVAHIPLPDNTERLKLLRDFAQGLLPAELKLDHFCEFIGGATAQEIKKIVSQATIHMLANGRHQLTLLDLKKAEQRVITQAHRKRYTAAASAELLNGSKPHSHMYS